MTTFQIGVITREYLPPNFALLCMEVMQPRIGVIEIAKHQEGE